MGHLYLKPSQLIFLQGMQSRGAMVMVMVMVMVVLLQEAEGAVALGKAEYHKSKKLWE